MIIIIIIIILNIIFGSHFLSSLIKFASSQSGNYLIVFMRLSEPRFRIYPLRNPLKKRCSWVEIVTSHLNINNNNVNNNNNNNNNNVAFVVKLILLLNAQKGTIRVN